VLIAVTLFVIVTLEAFQLVGHAIAFMGVRAAERGDQYTEAVTRIATIIDGYLFATIMLIFAMGLYELFISKIDFAEHSDLAERILLIRSIDDLKDRLAKVIFLILIVKFFEYALHQSYDTPLALMQLSVGIVLVAGALWLTGRSSH
jgi:uncharacterized membrane protein YqhA